jgi:hypothetical protein
MPTARFHLATRAAVITCDLGAIATHGDGVRASRGMSVAR